MDEYVSKKSNNSQNKGKYSPQIEVENIDEEGIMEFYVWIVPQNKPLDNDKEIYKNRFDDLEKPDPNEQNEVIHTEGLIEVLTLHQ